MELSFAAVRDNAQHGAFFRGSAEQRAAWSLPLRWYRIACSMGIIFAECEKSKTRIGLKEVGKLKSIKKKSLSLLLTAAMLGSLAVPVMASPALASSAPVKGQRIMAPAQVNQSSSYSVAISGDTSLVVGEDLYAEITVSSSEENSYNAYDFYLTYDSDALEYAGITETDVIEDAKPGSLHILGYGADKACATDKFHLKFTTKKVGETAVTLAKANLDKKSNANVQNAPAATITTSSVNVTVTGYPVNLSEDFTGAGTADPGVDYTFTAKDSHYDYTINAEVGGTKVDVTDNGDGTFTIPGDAVTGPITITDTKKGKGYPVTIIGDNTTGADTAYYMEDYSFTVEKESGYSYSITVTIDGAKYISMEVDGYTFTIPGEKILGPVVITVVKNKVAPDNWAVTFEGKGAGDAAGEAQVANGSAYSFRISKESGYDYTVEATMGGTACEITTEDKGYYMNVTTSGAGGVTGDLVFNIGKKKSLTVSVNEYVKLDGKTAWLVIADAGVDEGNVLAYGQQPMYWSEKYKAYCYLVISADNLAEMESIAKASIGEVAADKVSISYDYDVNETTRVDMNDAQLVYNIYNARYSDFEKVSIQKFLKADVNGDKQVSVLDSAAIVDYILNQSATL